MPVRSRLPALLAAVLMLPALASAQSNVYRWVDKDGKVHYSDTPPAPDAKAVTQKRLGGGAVEVPQLPFATRQAMEKSPAVLYVSPTCGDYCDQGRALLAKRGIPYSERDVSNAADADTVKKLIGSVSVPVLTLGERVMKGYAEGSWQSALDAAGYPRTALPGQTNPKPPAPAKPAPPPVPPAPPAPPAEEAAPEPVR
jgi:glutaredoxin